MSIKVLHLIDSGGLYGAEKMLLTLVKEQIKQGLQPMILSAGEPSITDKAIELEARRLGLPVTPWRMKPGLNIKSTKDLVRWARAAGYELFHSHGYKFNILLAALRKQEVGLPVVVTLHGYVHAKRFTKMWVYEFLDRWAIRRHDRIVLVSDRMWKIIEDDLANMAEVIPNGIELEQVRASASEPLSPEIADFRRGHHPLLISVGRLSYEKGFDLLLDAFAIFRTEHPQAGLLLLGEGHQRPLLEARISALKLNNDVLMPGYSNNVSACIRAADLLAISSRTEGLPITLLETMAIGTTIVTTAVGAIPKVLGHGRGGYIVENISSPAFAKAMSHAWEEAQLERRREEWAAERVSSSFSGEEMSRQYSEAYARAQLRAITAAT